MQDKEFDDQVRRRLAGYRPDYHPGDWNRLEGMLSGVESATHAHAVRRRRAYAMLTSSLLLNLIFLGGLLWQVRRPGTPPPTAPLATVTPRTLSVTPALAAPSALSAGERMNTRRSADAAPDARVRSAQAQGAHGVGAVGTPTTDRTSPPIAGSVRPASERMVPTPITGLNFHHLHPVGLPSDHWVRVGAIARRGDLETANAYVREDAPALAEADEITKPAKGEAQDRAKVPAISRWQVGAYASPDYNWTNSGTHSAPRYSAGLLVRRRLGARWGVESGLAYSRKTFWRQDFRQQTLALSATPVPLVSHGGHSYGLDVMRTHMHQIEVPLSVSLRLGASARQPAWLRAGVVAAAVARREQHYEYVPIVTSTGRQVFSASAPTSLTRVEQSSPSLYAALQVSAGKSWALGRRLQLELAPYWQIPVSRSTPERRLPITAGIQTRLWLPMSP
ncbi:MAG: hypothetical protein WBA12_06375 [Catalinimonas sp.]